jgi:ribonuclease P protein component
LRYPKTARLCAKKDIDRVFRDGRYRRLGWLHAKVLPTGLPASRFLVSVKRKIGDAHLRNRLRRLVREAIRLNRAQLQGSYDVCFFWTSAPERAGLAPIEAEVRKLFHELSQPQTTDKRA